MPEMPEVEAFDYYIKKNCLNKMIESVEVTDKKLIRKIPYTDFKQDLTGEKFDSVTREGKYLVIGIKPNSMKLIMHFGLTGFVVVMKDNDKKVRFSQVRFIFKNNVVLHWCDVRKFGKLWLVNKINEVKGLEQLGPDPLKLTQQEFIALMNKSKSKNIKAFLMDQSIISGIGNEYSDEILFQSGIDPHHKVGDLMPHAMKKIYHQMQKVLKYAIVLRKKNISKLGNQRLFSANDSTTFKSSYLQAHRHTDMRCPKNKNHMLKKATIAGRSAYYCPHDQR